MNQAIDDHRTRAEIQPTILTLFDVFCNTLVLTNTVPYLPVSSLVNLAATSKAFRFLVNETPGVFRHLDLTHVKTAQAHVDTSDRDRLEWHNVLLDVHLTEDEFYSGPLRGVFATLNRRFLLQDVQTLILDGLSVTAEICHEIINDPKYNVRLLSIRDAKNLNQGKLRGALTYACRPSRPKGSLKLTALYVFGSMEASAPALHAPTSAHKSTGEVMNQMSHKALPAAAHDEADPWWSKRGQILNRPINEEWARCLLACQDVISFDAVLCQGPRHHNSRAFGKTPLVASCGPAIATFAVGGCASCGKAPEGMLQPDCNDLSKLPLLSPPPIQSSSIRAATLPHQPCTGFVPRCVDCLSERYCPSCNKWWCESCYQRPGDSIHSDHVTIVEQDGGWNSLDNSEPDFMLSKAKAIISRSCWECGNNCDECIERTQRVCRKCCGGYCTIHNEGSSASFCDWCTSRGRGLTRL